MASSKTAPKTAPSTKIRRRKQSDSTSSPNSNNGNTQKVLSVTTASPARQRGINSNAVAIASPVIPQTCRRSPLSFDSPSERKSPRKKLRINATKTSRFFSHGLLIGLALVALSILALLGILRLLSDPMTPIGNVLATASDHLLNQISDPQTFLNPASVQSRARSWIQSSDIKTIQRYVLCVFYLTLSGGQWNSHEKWLTRDSECDWEGIRCDDNKQVTMIWLPKRDLRGQIPLELSSLSTLDTLTLNGNYISGTISPIFLSRLQLMRQLSLNDNRLSGKVPEELYDLKRLEFIGLQNNLLHGTLSSKIEKLQQLATFYMHENRLSGTIPKEIGSLTSTVEIALEHNYLTGTLPTVIGNLKKLKWLSLQSNKLTGTIPSELRTLSSLKTLYLYNNNFSGTVPKEICELTSTASLIDFYSDCHDDAPKVICPCCHACCSSDGCFNYTLKRKEEEEDYEVEHELL